RCTATVAAATPASRVSGSAVSKRVSPDAGVTGSSTGSSCQSRGHIAGTARQVAVIPDVAPAARRGEDRGGALPLRVRVLRTDPASGAEQARGCALEDPEGVEAVVARPQRERRVRV